MTKYNFRGWAGFASLHKKTPLLTQRGLKNFLAAIQRQAQKIAQIRSQKQAG
jgi:hypothetical protein